MRGSAASSSVKVGSPELTVGRVWLALSGRPLTPERWLQWRNFENDGLRSGRKHKMVMLRSGNECHLWKWYAPELKFRAENGGLSRGTYPICIIWKCPPPPGSYLIRVHLCSISPPFFTAGGWWSRLSIRWREPASSHVGHDCRRLRLDQLGPRVVLSPHGTIPTHTGQSAARTWRDHWTW